MAVCGGVGVPDKDHFLASQNRAVDADRSKSSLERKGQTRQSGDVFDPCGRVGPCLWAS